MSRRGLRGSGRSLGLRALFVVLVALLAAQGLSPSTAVAQDEADPQRGAEVAAEARNPDAAPAPGRVSESPGGVLPERPAAVEPEAVDTSRLVPLDGSAKPKDPVQLPNESKGSTKSSFDPATSVELVERRTATSDAWRNVDGTMSTMSYDTPKYFEAAKGRFEKIDSSVTADDKRPGWLRSGANEWVASFGPLSADSATGGVEIKGKSGSTLRFAPESAGASPDPANDRSRATPAAVTPAVDAEDPSVVRYVEVWPGVDVVYAVSPFGVKEDIVIKRKIDAASFSFAFDGAELTTPADEARAKQKMLDFSGALEGEFALAATAVADKAGRDVTGESKAHTLPERVERPAPKGQAPAAAKASRLRVGVDAAWLASGFDTLIWPHFGWF